MSTITENDLKELKNLIIAQNEKINADITDIKINQARMEGKLDKLEGKLEAVNARFDAYKSSLDKIPDLAEKVGELKNWRQFTFTLVAAFLTGFVGWFIRGLQF